MGKDPMEDVFALGLVSIKTIEEAHMVLAFAHQMKKAGILQDPRMAWFKPFLNKASSIIVSRLSETGAKS